MIGNYDTMSPAEGRNEIPIDVTPRRLAVQTDDRFTVTFVEIAE